MKERFELRPGLPSHDGRLAVACPCCSSDLTVDQATGAVLAHREPERPKAGGKSFDALLATVDHGKARAAALFDRGLEAQGDRERLLDAKFEEAMRNAGDVEDDEPPLRPWDLD